MQGLIITSSLNLSEQLDLSFQLSQTTTCQSSSQLALLLPWDAKLEAIGPVLLEDLDPVVVGVVHDDLLLQAEAEPMRRVELSLPRAMLLNLQRICIELS